MQSELAAIGFSKKLPEGKGGVLVQDLNFEDCSTTTRRAVESHQSWIFFSPLQSESCRGTSVVDLSLLLPPTHTSYPTLP